MFITKKAEKETVCYTYKVEMVVQVFAEDLETANKKLNDEGGYVSSRKVTLANTSTVFTDDEVSTKGSSETI